MEEAPAIVSTRTRLQAGSNVAQLWKQYAQYGPKQTRQAISIPDEYLKNSTPLLSSQFLQWKE